VFMVVAAPETRGRELDNITGTEERATTGDDTTTPAAVRS
jgi:hypothetical protein